MEQENIFLALRTAKGLSQEELAQIEAILASNV